MDIEGHPENPFEVPKLYKDSVLFQPLPTTKLSVIQDLRETCTLDCFAPLRPCKQLIEFARP